MMRDHVAISQEVTSYDCPKCGSGGACFVGMFVNGFRPMSRREQRRARKAAKRKAITKLIGGRPWNDPTEREDMLESMAFYKEGSRRGVVGFNSLGFYKIKMHERLLDYLREPSGFKAMSRVAEEMRLTKAHTPAFVDEAVTYPSERFKELLAMFTSDINAAAGAGESIYDLGEGSEP